MISHNERHGCTYSLRTCGCDMQVGIGANVQSHQGYAEGFPTVQSDSTGPILSRNLLGQFAEQLGYGI
jgi:hypothetical protein